MPCSDAPRPGEAAPDRRYTQDKLDHVTRLLCDVGNWAYGNNYTRELPEDVQEWLGQHRRADNVRRSKEAEQREDDLDRARHNARDALAKLKRLEDEK